MDENDQARLEYLTKRFELAVTAIGRIDEEIRYVSSMFYNARLELYLHALQLALEEATALRDKNLFDLNKCRERLELSLIQKE